MIVLLDGRVAGRLTHRKGGTLEFRYDENYRANREATPLSVTMPPQLALHSNKVVAPWLWGLLPDNEKVLARWGQQFHVSPRSAFQLLGTPVGLDCAGAVQFVHEDEAGDLQTRQSGVQWLTESEVADRLRLLKNDPSGWLGEKKPGQFSLAGSQAKTALILEDGRWGVPGGSIPTTHILKPAVAGQDDQEINEHLCMAAARRAGLIVAHTRIERFADQLAIVVQRYDRIRADGVLRRVHQEDLCQAMSLPPHLKYQSEGGPTPHQICRLLRQVMPPELAESAVARFGDALAWNWLIGGTDAHAKNYSLLLAATSVRLAPLYDIASALPYHHEKSLDLAMKIGDDYRVWLWKDNWSTAAKELGLEAEVLRGRVLELAERAPEAVRDAASEPEVCNLGSSLPQRVVDLIARRSRRCRSLLQRAGTQTSRLH